MSNISKESILKFLRYDENTGNFLWIDNFSRKSKQGKVAGGVTSHGYWRIQLPIGRFYAHRMAWIVCNGDIPKGYEIDHINGNKKDNRISNLRLVTRGQNVMNVGVKNNNTSGVKDVVWDSSRERWRVQITANGKHYYGGRFSSIKQAKEERNRLIKMVHGKFLNTKGEQHDTTNER